jgi:SAM-dependent methyltransferase
VKVVPRTKSEPLKRKTLPGLSAGDGFTPHPFDLENGVKTSGLIPGRHLKTGHRHDRHSTAYFGVAPSVFFSLLIRWQRTHPAAPIEDFTFIDVGAGMGRAMLLASELPFRRVIGIELNPALAHTARRNISRWRSAGRVHALTRLVQRDAVEFAFPSAPCLLFLFNPFGAPVLRRLLNNVSASLSRRPGQLDLIYVNNEQETVLEKQPGFKRLFQGQISRSRADAIADHKIMANQRRAEYTSSNFEDCSIWRWTGLARSMSTATKTS